jgi:uncharacterized protein (TIGR03435 family)
MFLPFLLLLGQEPPRFEAVSVRPDPPPFHYSQDFNPVKPGGKFLYPSASLTYLIAFAYDVKSPMQLTGLPGWTRGRSFAVSASAGADYPANLSPSENLKRVRTMLRNMLEDRFQLKLQTETKQEQVYELHVAKQGFQFPAVDPPVSPATAGPVMAILGDAKGSIFTTKGTMAGMAQTLEVFLHRPVLDRTGLTGYYDFNVNWESPNPNAESSGLGADGIALLISTLRSKFGLELKSTKGPVPYWVVDRLEPPTEND